MAAKNHVMSKSRSCRSFAQDDARHSLTQSTQSLEFAHSLTSQLPSILPMSSSEPAGASDLKDAPSPENVEMDTTPDETKPVEETWDDIPEDIMNLTPDEINSRIRLIENDIKVCYEYLSLAHSISWHVC